MPTVKSWLRNAQAVTSVANPLAAPDEKPASERLKRLTEENVSLQLQHLRTHPSVAGAMAREELSISGWVYDIATGEVRISENGDRGFHSVSSRAMEHDRLPFAQIWLMARYIGKPLIALAVYDRPSCSCTSCFTGIGCRCPIFLWLCTAQPSA